MLGQEPCQITFNLGHLSKPSFQGIRVIRRASYATTVGLFLQRPIFSHGQLYVAISLVKTLCCDKDVTKDNKATKGQLKEVIFWASFTAGCAISGCAISQIAFEIRLTGFAVIIRGTWGRKLSFPDSLNGMRKNSICCSKSLHPQSFLATIEECIEEATYIHPCKTLVHVQFLLYA
ncbi:hypothetical protein Tco_0610222 [Tanacetum coccineum]